MGTSWTSGGESLPQILINQSRPKVIQCTQHHAPTVLWLLEWTQKPELWPLYNSGPPPQVCWWESAVSLLCPNWVKVMNYCFGQQYLKILIYIELEAFPCCFDSPTDIYQGTAKCQAPEPFKSLKIVTIASPCGKHSLGVKHSPPPSSI